MSSFRKRSPTSKPARPIHQPRQNPQRWRQAFGDLRPATTTGSSVSQQRNETQFAMRWGAADANVAGNLYEGLPEPAVSAATMSTKTDPEQESVFTSKRPHVFGTDSSSSSMDGPPSQGETTATTVAMVPVARNPIWKSTMTQVRKADEISFHRSATPPPVIGSDRELEDLIGKSAHSADDRYKILDSLDKMVRKRNPKVKVRVEFAVKLAGTCMDMCPEKERYMREVQRRLSFYECDSSQQDSVVDHQLAIKEYSRSSADQEEPLPHDLRPIQSLHLTFDYLLHNIISRMEDENESLSDLYYFIWDRTRALRKDMTQQQLGTTEAVFLMEKCARFHIYCSTRLCELDRHSFDPKLNDENLMKCLQSLEHMYQDLVPHGIECPNEPEFRAYQILMHLNEGDVVREIQQKPHRILKSAPVAHALKIYVALNNMNSVAFFRLVEKSSFMVSCLLHRYFFQVRTNALRRFLKTFSLKSAISMPTMQVKRILGFGPGDENINTFKYFCESHGFAHGNIGPTSMILRNRSEFEQPEFNLISREHSLIESKLKFSVSEAINGAPLGQNPMETYVPHSSFDENGYFKRELLDALNLKLKPVSVTPQAHVQATSSPKGTSSPGDIRSRLGTRVGLSPLPASAEIPVAIKALGSSDSSQPQPQSLSTFSFASGLAPPRFGSIASESLPLSNFSFKTTIAGQSGIQPPKFGFSSATLGSSGENFAATQAEAALQKAKAAETNRRIATEFEHKLAQDILVEVLAKEVREIATIVRQENILKAAKELLQKALTLQIYKELEINEMNRMIRNTAEYELRKTQNVTTACMKIENEFRAAVVLGLIKQTAREVFNQHIAENEFRLAKLDEICSRINQRNWFISWKNSAAEKKLNRLQELERQKWNVENFPPILAAQFPTYAILTDWSGSAMIPLVEKHLYENSSFELVERAMDLKRTFQKHVDEYRPSIIHHLVAPLLDTFNAVPELPQICTEFHPPVAINIILYSADFGPWDQLANWTWSSLLEDSTSLGDSNYCAYSLSNDRNMYLTFQKCTNLESSGSIDSRAIIVFHCDAGAELLKTKPQFSVLNQLKTFATKNPSIPIVILNASSETEQEILRRIGVEFENSAANITIIEVKNGQVVENIPALVQGLQWVAEHIEVGPPLTPPVILLPFAHLAAVVIQQVYSKRFKGITCPSQLYGGHNDLVKGLKALVQNPKTLEVLKRWPGRATKLLIQKYSKSICFSHEAGMLSVVIKALKELESVLLIDFPQDLISKWHHGMRMGQLEVQEGFKREITKLTEGFPVSDNLRTRFNYVLSLQRKEGSIPWKEFLTVCQEFVLEKLYTLNSSAYQVCVDLTDIQRYGFEELMNLPRCPSSASCGISRRKRGFSLDKDFTFLLSSKSKTLCKDSHATLLENMGKVVHIIQAEKIELDASFTELQHSVL